MPRQGRRTLNIGPSKAFTRTERIKIPQPTKRPIKILQKAFIRESAIKRNPWWWITHRRGIKGRPRVGGDPREMRAISHDLVKGTLPERIVYLWLVTHHFVPQMDFTFQSSQQGGRLELGGVVVDFLFERMLMVLQVNGPTHGTFMREKKDEEQRLIMAAKGYSWVDLDEQDIYDEPKFEELMRAIFNLTPHQGGASVPSQVNDQSDQLWDPLVWERLYWKTDRILLDLSEALRLMI